MKGDSKGGWVEAWQASAYRADCHCLESVTDMRGLTRPVSRLGVAGGGRPGGGKDGVVERKGRHICGGARVIGCGAAMDACTALRGRPIVIHDGAVWMSVVVACP